MFETHNLSKFKQVYKDFERNLNIILDVNQAAASTEIFCSSCRLKFEDLTSYKLHLTTEFHVYNAKRRAADLAPISQKLFEQKRKDLLSVTSSVQSERNYYCKPCKKK